MNLQHRIDVTVRWIAVSGFLFCFPGGVTAQSREPAIALKPGQPHYAALFLRMDQNSDGRISLKEYQGQAQKNELVQRNLQFKQFDENHDQSLSRKEFKYAPQARPSRPLRFEWKDVNRDQQLELSELLRGEEGRWAAFVRRVITLYDTDQNGTLSFTEWKNSPDCIREMGNLLLQPRDLDGDDRINMQEILTDVDPSKVKNLRAHFEKFDLNHDRFLDREEFPVNTNLFDGATTLWGGNALVIFKRLDNDGSGSLSRDEFRKYEFPDYVQKNENTRARFERFQKNADQILDRFDKDRNHQLSLEEFAPSVTLLFSRLDQDQDSRLSLDEYRIWISKKVPLEQVRYDFKLYDQDQNQSLSIDEFKVTPLFHPSDDMLFAFFDQDHNDALSLAEFQRQKPDSFAADLKWNFHRYDANNDDRLSLQEFSNRGAGIELESLTLFKQKDSDSNGKLTTEEFTDRIPSKNQIEWALKSFSVADKDKDGLLTQDEFKLSPIGRPDLLSKFEYYDSDQNGTLSFKEWEGTKAYPDTATFTSMFQLFDTNQNKKLEMEEFKYTPPGGPSSKLRFAWKDVNHDGQLSQVEALRGEFFRQAALMRHVHARFDANKDDFLSFSEWQDSPVHLLRDRDLLLSVRDLDGDDQINLKDCLGTASGDKAKFITKYFKAFDANKDQFLQRSEFPVITDLFNGTGILFREDYRTVFSILDADEDHFISRKEFKARQLTKGQRKQAWAIRRKKAFVKYADQTFDRLDVDHDQRLSLNEYAPPRELIYSRIDVNQDERLTLPELALVLSGLDPEDLEYEFRLCDQNQDQALIQAEFSCFSYFFPDRSKLFSLFDQDQNSELNLTEFQRQQSAAHAADLKTAFHRFDANNDDSLSLDEYEKQGEGLELDSLTSFNIKDTDGDHQLSLDEFLKGKPQREIEGATRNFNHADTDKNQLLTDVEFKLTPAGRPDALSKLEYLDTDGDGALSLVEFNGNYNYRQLMFRGFIFSRFDQNQDGQLDLQEFRKTPIAEPVGLLGIPDKNGDRKLSLSEFTQNRSGKRLQLTEYYFSRFDVDQDNWLRHDEFPVPVDQNLPRYSLLYDAGLTLARLDADGDGVLNLEEFRSRQTPDNAWSKAENKKWLETADELFASQDLDQDQKLSLKELSTESPMSPSIIAPGEILHSAPGMTFHEWSFGSMDRNKDHLLNLEEYLRPKPERIHETATVEFQQADHDQNASLTFEEYKYLPNSLYIPWDDFWWRDKDHDQLLTADEFSVRHYRSNPVLGQRTLEAFDQNQDGKLSYTEFLATPDANPIGLPLSRIRDNNNDGRIGLREFSGMLNGSAKLLAENYFTVFDRDQNDELSWGEFAYRLDNTSFPTREIFVHYDANQDELLTFAEMYPDQKKQSGKPGTYALTNQKRFRTLDRNRDGFVNWDEYKTSDPGTRMKNKRKQQQGVAVTFTGGTPAAWIRPEDRPVPPSAKTVFKNKDKSHDGKLSFSEYLGRHYSPQSEAAAKVIFAYFNRDRDEFLSFDEFKACPIANPDAETLFISRDRNQDHQLDFKEFLAYRAGEGPQKYLGEIFARFDANGDENLSLDEFKATPDGRPTSDIILSTRDMNGDGRLDITEYSDVPTDHPTATLKTQFEWLDLNHDGYLTMAELKINDPIIPDSPSKTTSLSGRSSWINSQKLFVAIGIVFVLGLLFVSYKAGKWKAARNSG